MSERSGMEERACAHIGDMVETEMAAKLGDRRARHGVIPADDLDAALADIERDIADFERSPSGDSTRNALVLGLVRRVCVSRLRAVARRVKAARDAGADIAVEQLVA